MNGHSEPGGKFHPHNDKPGIHSGSVNTSSIQNTGFAQRGSKKTLQHESRESPIKIAHVKILVDQLDTKGQETPEQTYNRVEPLIEKLQNNDDVPEMAKNYLSDLLNDLEEPNAEPDEYDDGAKFDNYAHTLSMVKENLS
jgi:hypothetical protein